MSLNAPEAVPVGGGEDLPLDGDGDEALLLHLPGQPVPDEHPGVHRQPVPAQLDLTLGVPGIGVTL